MAVSAIGALAACTSSHDSGELLIDPGRYTIYKCDDLAARWKLVSARERELRGLMDRAAQTGGGVVVGTLAYRAEYDAVLSDERQLQRNAAEKNCGLPFQAPIIQPAQSGQSQGAPSPVAAPQNTQYQSDSGIR